MKRAILAILAILCITSMAFAADKATVIVEGYFWMPGNGTGVSTIPTEGWTGKGNYPGQYVEVEVVGGASVWVTTYSGITPSAIGAVGKPLLINNMESLCENEAVNAKFKNGPTGATVWYKILSQYPYMR